MDTAGYVALTRQSGLMREMRVIANNVANMSTSGFKAEGVLYAEHIQSGGSGYESVSMATGRARHVDLRQGGLTQTNGAFDLAIDGDGFFLIQGPDGEELTRAGHFTPDANGQLVTDDGSPVLDAGGAPILLPLDGGTFAVGSDGTISQNGKAVGQIGIVAPQNPDAMTRAGNTRFKSEEGWEPLEAPTVVQGFLESSNVNGMEQISRMIEVQRAYEMGRTLMDKENERIRAVIDKLGK